MHKNSNKRRSIVVEQNRYLEAYGPKSLFTYLSHVTVHKILRAGFPPPLNTSGSACFRSENWLKFITTEKAVIFIIFKFSFI